MVRRFALSVGIFALVASALAPCAGAAGEAKPEGGLSILGGGQALEVKADEGADTATGAVTLFNSGAAAVQYSVSLQASGSAAVRLEDEPTGTIAGGEVARVELTFSGLKGIDEGVDGQLAVGGGAQPLTQAVELDPAPHPDVSWTVLIVAVSFLVTVLLALAVAPMRPHLGLFLQPAQKPELSLKSWATNLTVLGGIVTAAIGALTFPEFPTEISKNGIVRLGIFFGALVVLAPFVFDALRRVQATQKQEESGEVGNRLGLLIACAVTIWGVLGQTATFALLGWEVADGDLERGLIVAAATIMALLVVRYFLITAYWKLRRPEPEPEAAPSPAALRWSAREEPAEPPAPEPTRWSLL